MQACQLGMICIDLLVVYMRCFSCEIKITQSQRFSFFAPWRWPNHSSWFQVKCFPNVIGCHWQVDQSRLGIAWNFQVISHWLRSRETSKERSGKPTSQFRVTASPLWPGNVRCSLQIFLQAGWAGETVFGLFGELPWDEVGTEDVEDWMVLAGARNVVQKMITIFVQPYISAPKVCSMCKYWKQIYLIGFATSRQWCTVDE